MNDMQAHFTIDEKFFSFSENVILDEFTTGPAGLSTSEYETRLVKYGYNDPMDKKKKPLVLRFILKFISPLNLTLIVIATFSYVFAERISAFFVFGMSIMSALVEFVQEEKATREAEKLTEMVRVKTTVLRENKEHHVSMRNIVPGDLIILKAGDLVPADLRLIEANDLFVNQSTFTGESFPVQKGYQALKLQYPTLQECNNLAFMGSSIVSGTGLGLVVQTAKDTEFGKLSNEINRDNEETTFDRGVKDFTIMMLRILIVLGLVVFLINFLAKGDVVNAILFALAVAVGLTPDMLP